MMNPQPMLLAQYWKAEQELQRERRGVGQRSPVRARRTGLTLRRTRRPAAVA